jgi:hypothetical protein
VNSALATQLADAFAINNSKLESELVPHLVTPLQLQRRRANDQNRPNPVSQNHLLHHKTRLDRLSETYVVSDQQVHPRHGQRAHHRIQLIIVDFYAAAKRRVQRAIVTL